MAMNSSKINPGVQLLVAFLATLLLAAAGQANDSGDGDTRANPGGSLIVNVDDLRGLFNLDVEWIRKDLLENAFNDAAKRRKWLGDYRFTYNEPLPKHPRNHLEIRLFDWSRNRANFFEFSASAIYFDSDGKSHNLGITYGTRSGIDVTMRYDIGERFADVAEDAFGEALRKLKKLDSRSSG